MDIDDLAKLTRYELQQRAKALGVRANQKSSELIEAIRAKTLNVPVTPKTPAVSRKTLQAKGEMSGDFSPDSSPGSGARLSPFIFSEQKQALSQIASTTSASKSPFGSVPRQINVRLPLVVDSPQQQERSSSSVSRPANVLSSPVVMKPLSPKVVVSVEDAKVHSPQQQPQQQFPSSFARPIQATPSAFQKSSALHESSLSTSFQANSFVVQLNENSTKFHNQKQNVGQDNMLLSTTKGAVKFAVEETPSKFNLKEAMRIERERRRILKSQVCAEMEFERIESRSKPGQFYYWNPLTQQTCWELPKGARLAGVN